MQTIAIPVEDDRGLDSRASSSFGDAKHYLIVQVEEGRILSAQTRPATPGQCGRWSCRAEAFLAENGCDVVVAPRVGRTATKLFAEANVGVAEGRGRRARELLESYLAGGGRPPAVNQRCPHSSTGPFTAAVHAGGMDEATGSVTPPIYQTSTFAFANAAEGAARFAGEREGYIYTRMGNPTVRALEQSVARLEGGYDGLATASGMAAVVTILMTFLGKNLHVVGTDSVYGPSRVVVEKDLSRFGVEHSFVDTSDLATIRAAMRPNTRLLYIETPANPTLKLADIAACAEIAHERGALLVVDNTFMSPHLQKPFRLGADIVFHSLTKSLNGHADVVGGMIVARDEALWRQLRGTLIYLGGTMDPHQAYLVVRGIKTLPLRVERAQQNARALAEYLEAHPRIEWVAYPGLPSHPQYELARRQMEGPGSLISFEVRGGLSAGQEVMNRVKVMLLAVSLGGVESLIQHPASMTHASMSPESRLRAGITDGLVRLSVGCEDYEDLRDDLEQALAAL